jgi:hypothetical protein
MGPPCSLRGLGQRGGAWRNNTNAPEASRKGGAGAQPPPARGGFGAHATGKLNFGTASKRVFILSLMPDSPHRSKKRERVDSDFSKMSPAQPQIKRELDADSQANRSTTRQNAEEEKCDDVEQNCLLVDASHIMALFTVTCEMMQLKSRDSEKEEESENA